MIISSVYGNLKKFCLLQCVGLQLTCMLSFLEICEQIDVSDALLCECHSVNITCIHSVSSEFVEMLFAPHAFLIDCDVSALYSGVFVD